MSLLTVDCGCVSTLRFSSRLFCFGANPWGFPRGSGIREIDVGSRHIKNRKVFEYGCGRGDGKKQILEAANFTINESLRHVTFTLTGFGLVNLRKELTRHPPRAPYQDRLLRINLTALKCPQERRFTNPMPSQRASGPYLKPSQKPRG